MSKHVNDIIRLEYTTPWVFVNSCLATSIVITMDILALDIIIKDQYSTTKVYNNYEQKTKTKKLSLKSIWNKKKLPGYHFYVAGLAIFANAQNAASC